MAFQALQLTNAAETFTAQAWASSGVITVTRVAFGSGFPGVNDYVPGYTGLKTFVMNGTITGINNLVAGQLTVRANISSANAPSTFNVNEIGVFGKFQGGPETLLAYITTGANTGDTMTPTGVGTPVIKDYALLMVFQQAINSSGVIQLNQVVGLHAASHISTGVDPIPVAVSTASGLVPVPGGTGANALCDTSPVSWVPFTPVINVNTTLYVANGNPDIAPNFSTIPNAMNYLLGYSIAPGVSITINVAGGTYSYSSTILIAHPNGSQINIVGPNNADVTFSGIGTVSGSAGNWSIPLTGVSSTANIAVNGYVSIFYAALNTLGCALAAGFYKVTNVSGSTVTVNSKYYGASFPSVSGSTGGVMTPITAILSPAQNVTAMNVGPGGLGNLKYIGAVAATPGATNYNPSGFIFLGPSTVYRCGAQGFRNASNIVSGGFYASTAAVILIACTATNCSIGFIVASSSSVNIQQCASSNNVIYDYWINGNSSCSWTNGYSFAVGTNAIGILISNGSQGVVQVTYVGGTVTNSTMFSLYHGNYGASVLQSNMVNQTNNTFYLSNNTNYDVNVSLLSVVQGTSLIQGTRVFNATPGTLTADGCYMS